ncbi:unnamed protein product [Closterium sp. NIES-65]|nr:unnamed protein product [Closterium sp. NIES-65]
MPLPTSPHARANCLSLSRILHLCPPSPPHLLPHHLTIAIAPSGTTSPSLPHHPVFPSMLLSPSSPAHIFAPLYSLHLPPTSARAACSSRFALEAWRLGWAEIIAGAWGVLLSRPKSGGQSGCVGWAEIIDDAWGGDYGGCVGCCPWVERVEWPGAVGKLDIGKVRVTLDPLSTLNPHLLIPHLLLRHGLPSLCRGRTVRPHSSTVEAADVAEVHERLQAKLGEAGLLGASWWCLRSDEQRKEEVHSE